LQKLRLQYSHPPGPRRVLGGGSVPSPAGNGKSGPGLSEDRRGIRPYVDEDVEAIPRTRSGSCSTNQGRERQILVLGHGQPSAHLVDGDPHGGVDEGMDGEEVEVEGARSGEGEAEQVRVGTGEERGGFGEAAEVAWPPEEGAAAAGGGVGARRGVEEGGGGWGSVWGDGAVADEHGRRRRRRHAQLNDGGVDWDGRTGQVVDW